MDGKVFSYFLYEYEMSCVSCKIRALKFSSVSVIAIYVTYILFLGRLFFDDEDAVNQFNNCVMLKELDDIDVKSSML